MNTNQGTPFLVLKEDYEALAAYLRNNEPELKYEQLQAQKLSQKLQEAEVVSPNSFPMDVIRLRSKVKLRDARSRMNREYSVVLPDQMLCKETSVSVLTPLGKQMLGARKGDTLTVEAPTGKKYYLVYEVLHPL